MDLQGHRPARAIGRDSVTMRATHVAAAWYSGGRMSRAVLYMAIVASGLVMAGCGPADTPARAEPVAPTGPLVTPAPAADSPEASVTQRAAALPNAANASSSEPKPAESGTSPQHSTNALEDLKAQLDEIASKQIEVVPASKPAGPAGTAPGADVQQLRGEVQDLRREVARLQETVDAALAYLVGELGDENRRLKKDIAPPDEAPQDGAVQDAAPPASPAPAPVAVPPRPPVDYGKDGYLSIKEWGRTPDQAKEMGGKVSSLRGMICAVRPGAADDELKAIGKTLRAAAAGYDNINIDVFDDEAAAHEYADQNVRSSEHFVMNITRHKASGRDVIVLVRDNGAREVIVE